MSKILTIDELSSRLGDRRVVLSHGRFDFLHIGYVRHLQHARRLGDLLVVTVIPDEFIDFGPARPAFTEQFRLEALAALECVDFVALSQGPTAVEDVRRLRPAVFARGAEAREQESEEVLAREKEALAAVGASLEYTEELSLSSTRQLQELTYSHPLAVSEFLAGFRTRHRAADVVDWLRRTRDMRVLVVGEAIIDDYVYCNTLGKSGKEPVLCVQFQQRERFAGGVVAVANHVAALVEQVDMLTVLGAADPHEEFLRERLMPNVRPHFLYAPEAPTIQKQRFLETYPLQKLFEVYHLDEYASHAVGPELLAFLQERASDYDLVLVADYGHGMLTPEAVASLERESRYLAVNTQVNAGNAGFNTISKYARADFISISERELRLDARDKRGDLREMIRGCAQRAGARRVIITRGASGALGYSPQDGFVDIPSLTQRVVDRVGAGDTVLAVASLLAAQGAPIEVVGLVGNAAGAQAVAVVGNRVGLDAAALIKQLQTLV